MDKPYREDDHSISPHWQHMIQPLDDGKWHCLTCEGPLMCPECEAVVTNDGEACAECLSEQAGYYVEGGQG